MIKKYFYCYVSINKINGKCYCGSHSSTLKFNSQYKGSGKLLKQSIKKYGKCNFLCVPLKYFDKITDARLQESYYISLFDTLNPKGYNLISTGGLGLNDISWGNHTKETKIQLKNSHTGKKFTKEHCHHISIAQTNRIFSSETIKLMSNARKGKSYEEFYKDKAQIMKQKRSDQTKGKGNPMYGYKHEKLLCSYCNKLIDKPNYNRWHGENCKYK